MNCNLFSGRKIVLSRISVHIVVLAAISMVLLIATGMAIGETGDVCVDHYKPGSVCTAQDLRIVDFEDMNVTSPCDPTTGLATATFLVHVTAAGSPDRYNMGIFLSQDGNSALTGHSCLHDFLDCSQPGISCTTVRPTADTFGTQAAPYWNDGDVCADVATGNDTHRLVTLTFACKDLNGDGLVDIPACLGWDNSAVGCGGVTQAIPETKSKCGCQIIPTNIPIGTPAISVTKAPATQTVTTGGTANFTITVTNTGNVTLTNITTTDPNAPGCNSIQASLAPNASFSFTCSVTGVSSGFTNTITATGTPPTGPDVSATASADVLVDIPAISVIKSPSFQKLQSGGTATFTIAVTNPGSVPLGSITVVDAPPCSNLSGPTGDTNSDGFLDPGETWVLTCAVNNVTEPFINTVTVTGTPVGGGSPVSDSDTAQVIIGATAVVPTMNEWGMIILAVLAGLGSVYYLRRQRRT